MNARKDLREIMEGFQFAMVATRQRSGIMHARPMVIAGTDAGCDVHFATSIVSRMVADIGLDHHVLITLQSSARFCSLEGQGSITRERADIQRLWRDAWFAWFPAGMDDPALCILTVSVTSGGHWDAHGQRNAQVILAQTTPA
jgi:general stress protein 26